MRVRHIEYFQRLRRDRKGMTAVEFALIAGPFFFLLVSVFEVMVIFFVATSLENAAMEAARLVRTGQVDDTQKATVETNMCDWVDTWGDCTGHLAFDVRGVGPTVEAGELASAIDDGVYDTSDVAGMLFDTGESDEFVIVRVYYEWTVSTPLVGAFLANVDGNRRILVSTAVFKNEPF